MSQVESVPRPMDFVGGGRSLFAGYGLIWRRGLKRFLFVPLAINTVLFGFLLYRLGSFFDRVLAQLLPGWLAWLLWPIFALTVVLVAFYAFTLVANLLSAPFNGLLAERVEQHLTGQAPPGSQGGLSGMLAELPAAIGGELRKLVEPLISSVAVATEALRAQGKARGA